MYIYISNWGWGGDGGGGRDEVQGVAGGLEHLLSVVGLKQMGFQTDGG